MSPIRPRESEITRCPFGRRTRTNSRECLRQVGDMAQRDRADDQIDGIVGERHVVQLGLVELALGDLLAGEPEHLGRCVDGDHLVAERREVRAVAARAAGGLESDAERKAVEDLAHERLFEIKKLIFRLVVETQRNARSLRSS